MKKFILAALAALTVACTPAEAQRVSGGVSVTFGDRYDNYRNDRYLENRYARDSYRRHFRNQRSWYRGRCGYREVVVTDPWTGRRVCMHARDYERYRHDRQRYRF